MKITIDLAEVLNDEFGNTENLAESIKQQLVCTLQKELSKGIQERINSEVGKLIDEQIKEVVKNQLPALLNDLMDKEYEVVDRWGSRSCKTTLRASLLKNLSENMEYKPQRYDSEKNVFTRSADELVKSLVGTFQSEYNKKVDEMFAKEVMDIAVAKIQQKLGLKV